MTSIFSNIQKNWFTFQTPLVWRNVIGIFLLHLIGIYTFIWIVPKARLITIIFAYSYGYFGAMSVTIGAHRLWTHKTYKGTLPLRIFLMIGYLAAGQYTLVQWARDHRLHHKHSDTEADPHNAKRGFFYSHCGWLMMKRTAESKEKGKLIDVSDLLEDPVVVFQQKYYAPLLVFFHIIFPVVIVGHYMLGENLLYCMMGLLCVRYIIILNIIWTVNSVTHLYGYKPYNKFIMAVQNKTAAFFTGGEGWHNFHHVFPWDYRIGEFGQGFQHGAAVIELFSKLGLAYKLKSVPPEMIKRVLMKSSKLDNEVCEVPESALYENEMKHHSKREISAG